MYVTLYDGITGELKEVHCDSVTGGFDVNEREPFLLVAMLWDGSQRPRCVKKTAHYMTSKIVQ